MYANRQLLTLLLKGIRCSKSHRMFWWSKIRKLTRKRCNPLCLELVLWVACSVPSVLNGLLRPFSNLFVHRAKAPKRWRHICAPYCSLTQHHHLLDANKYNSTNGWQGGHVLIANTHCNEKHKNKRPLRKVFFWGSSCIQMIDNTITLSLRYQCFSYRNDNTFQKCLTFYAAFNQNVKMKWFNSLPQNIIRMQHLSSYSGLSCCYISN